MLRIITLLIVLSSVGMIYGQSSSLPSFIPLFFTNEIRSPDYLNHPGYPQRVASENKLTSFNQIMAFPNPASENITLSFEHVAGTQLTVELIDMIGNPVKRWIETMETFSFRKEFLLSDITSGVYFIRVSDGRQAFVKKVIVEK